MTATVVLVQGRGTGRGVGLVVGQLRVQHVPGVAIDLW